MNDALDLSLREIADALRARKISPVELTCLSLDWLRVAEYAYVMDRGRVALKGPADAVKADPELIRYLSP